MSTMSVVARPYAPPDAGLIEEARARQRRRRGVLGAVTAAGLAAVVLAFAWGGGSGGAGGSQPLGRPPVSGPGLAARNGGSGTTRSISSVGVSLVVPRGWFGRSQVLSAGTPDFAAWLQASNFPTQTLVHGEDPIKAMGTSDVVVTISDQGPAQWTARPNGVQLLALTPDETLPPARTPRGHLVIESSALLDGRRLTIDADFGSPAAAHRLLSTVNRMLSTLRVHTASHT
jgi:hypothetical protein